MNNNRGVDADLLFEGPHVIPVDMWNKLEFMRWTVGISGYTIRLDRSKFRKREPIQVQSEPVPPEPEQLVPESQEPELPQELPPELPQGDIIEGSKE